MNTKHATEVLHREHEEIAGFLGAFEKALELAVSEEDESRSIGLAELREIVDQSARIRGSFFSDSAVLSSPILLLVAGTERAQLKQRLFRLERASYEFRRELSFSTTVTTEGLVEQGRRLGDMLRQEIAYEDELLGEVETSRGGNPAQLGSKE